MSKPKSMMGITSPTGSHLPVLEAQVAKLPQGALVIEHGAGLYSTVLLARMGANVLCSEPDPGWSEWARWVYQGKVEIVNSYKRAADRLGEAALVFLDGPARERGRLLDQCFTHKVPVIIAHDTQEGAWPEYGYQPHMFKHVNDYTITRQESDPHTTTLWVRRA